MTNCPNCGAPYKLDSRVCEYCGTVREESPGQIKTAQKLEQARVSVERAEQRLSALRFETAQKAQYDNITFNFGNGNVIVNSAIGVNNKVAQHNSYGIDGEYEALKQSIEARYNALKGRAASDSEQIQATHKTVTPGPENTDEQFKKDVLVVCSMIILPLVLVILGYFGVENTKNEILLFLSGLAFIGGIMAFDFSVWYAGIVFCFVKLGESWGVGDDSDWTY